MNTPILNFKPEGPMQGDLDANNLSIWNLSQIGVWTTTTENLTVTGTLSLAAKSANTFLRGPTSGTAASPTFGALVSGDLPTLPITLLDVSEATPDPIRQVLGYTPGIGVYWTGEFSLPDTTDVPDYSVLGLIGSTPSWVSGLPAGGTSRGQIGYWSDE